MRKTSGGCRSVSGKGVIRPSDWLSLVRIVWERPQPSPPPKLFPHKLETFMASLSPRQAQEIRASTDSVFWDDVPVWNG